MSEECCGNCRFGRISPKNVKEIDCFRYPSQVTVIPLSTPGGFAPGYFNGTPVMESSDWCGEYQPKKGKTDVSQQEK